MAASGARTRGAQARAAASSGIEFAVALLSETDPAEVDRRDNPDLLSNRLVVDDGANRWYFTVYADNPTDREHVRYGLIDEAGKVNINTASESMLLALGLTGEQADCLLDYRDRDAETRPQGAEQDWYDTLETPYLIKNAPLATLEELMLVRHFDASVVFGEDANCNGMLEANETDGDESFPPDNADGELDTGLRTIATVVTYEPAVSSEGKNRVDINTGKVEGLGLPDQMVQFVRTYLKDGNKFSHPAELLKMTYKPKAPKPRPRRNRRRRRDKPRVMRSGVGAAELPKVLDVLTATGLVAGGKHFGLININSAPPQVLAALDGIDENLARRIADARGSLEAEAKGSIAWLYSEGLVDAAAFKRIAPRLTARSFQYRIRCVGFGVPCGQYRILEAVVDLAGRRPRIGYLRDVTALGVPFALGAELQER